MAGRAAAALGLLAAAAATEAEVGAEITSVHVVYMTHLDVGFTDTARNVCDKYFNDYFPQAFATAAALRARGGPEQYRWTEFPWLISEFLDGAAGCAHRARTDAELKAMEDAIQHDDIIWHASSLNFFPELLDEDMWRYSLDDRARLNARFGKAWGAVAGKHTDVPGMSRGALPSLKATGVKAYHIGYNGACAKNVKFLPQAFRWRDVASDTEILAMVNDNYGSEIVVGNGTHGLGKTLLHRPAVKGAEGIALVFQYTMDNGGAPSVDTVLKFWSQLQAKYPKAKVQASSLDAFFEEVLSSGDYASLPVVTGEIGDSWIYGAPADPIKVATFREARRAMQEAVAAEPPLLDPASPEYARYMRRLMKGPAEHNWGLSIDHNGWATDWDNAPFAKRRQTDADFQRHELEWRAQREWMHACTPGSAQRGTLPLTCGAADPAAALPTSPAFEAFVKQLDERLLLLEQPARLLPDVASLGAALSPQQVQGMTPMQCGGVHIAFSGEDGSIRYLKEDRAAAPWVSDTNATKRLAAFRYQTYGTDAYKVFSETYTTSGDFMKQGMETSKATSKAWDVSLTRGYLKQTGSGCSFVMQLALADAAAVADFGAPRNISLEYTVPGRDGSMVDISLVWTNKTMSRLAESFWLSFVPEAEPGAAWTMDVLGHPISPLEVVQGGTRHIHAVQDHVRLAAPGRGALRIRTLDAPLVCPGDRDHMLKYTDDQPDALGGGMHFNLHNNLWGTAFPQWYGDDGVARFSLISEAQEVLTIV